MSLGNGAFIVHEALQAGIPGYRLAPFDPRFALFPPLLRFASRPPADLIHTSPDIAAFFSRADVPLVITFHNYVLDAAMRGSSGLFLHLYHTTLLRRLTRKALEQARAVTAVSRFTAELVRRDMGWDGPLRVIYNGIDTEAFRPAAASRAADNARVRVLYCGNLTARKGVHLIPAILDALEPHVDFLYTSGLRTTRRGIPHPRAISAGTVAYADMPALYNSADILLFPTQREGFGLAVAEAMSCGLPIVASDCSSMPELVVAGRSGFLCAPGDVRDLAARINLLAADPALRRQMGAFNRARAETLFRRERMFAEYRALFEEVLSSRR